MHVMNGYGDIGYWALGRQVLPIHLKRLGDRLVETQSAPSPTSRFVVSLHQMLPPWSTPGCTHDVARVKTAVDEEVRSVDIRRVV